MDRCTQLYIDGEMQGPSYGSGIGRASIPEEGKWDGDRCWVEDQDGAHVVECERRDGREAIRWSMPETERIFADLSAVFSTLEQAEAHLRTCIDPNSLRIMQVWMLEEK